MITKITKILLELFFLVVAIGISMGILIFAFDKVNLNSKLDVFSAKINKKELVMISPTFATIESLNVYEGQMVREGDVLATLKTLTEFKNQSDNKSLIDGDTYKTKGNFITVYAPSDSIIGKVIYAEKSSVRPEIEIMMLYPLKSSSILINDKLRTFDMENYSSLSLKDQNNDTQYPVKLLDTFPVDIQNDGGRTIYAIFDKNEDSTLFDNGSTVTILASKKVKGNNFILDIKNVIFSKYESLMK